MVNFNLKLKSQIGENVKQMPELKAVGFKLDDFVQGGLISDKDFHIRALTATTWDYNGKADETLAVKADMDVLDDNGDVEDQIEHYFSIGSPTDFQASADGKQILSEVQLRKNSNWHIFLASLYQNGFPQDKVTNSLSCFEGMIFHGIRAPAPKREGLKNQVAKGETEYEKQVLICAASGTHKAISKMPWEKKAAPKKAGAKAAGATAPRAAASASTATSVNGAPAPEAAPSGDINIEALDALKAVLAANDTITLDGMKMAAFKVVMKRPVEIRSAIVKMLCDPNWLNEQMAATNGEVFIFDAGTVARVTA